MHFECLICGHTASAAKEIGVREMMFGKRDSFDYVECANCQSLQIAALPSEQVLRDAYGGAYYSFANVPMRGLQAQIARFRDMGAFGYGGLLGKLAWKARPEPVIETLAQFGLKRSRRILDVGCGGGRLLDRLARAGFDDLLGIDPFVEPGTVSAEGVEIEKATVGTLDPAYGQFDFIMFNHSLEHAFDPAGDLKAASERLTPQGRIIMRLPTPSSDAWDRYGADWVQLDAPRHIALPSRQGMDALAARAGLRIDRMKDDSQSFSYWGSELYKQDVSLLDKDGRRHPETVLSPEKIAACAQDAKRANAAQKGDQVAVLLAQ